MNRYGWQQNHLSSTIFFRTFSKCHSPSLNILVLPSLICLLVSGDFVSLFRTLAVNAFTPRSLMQKHKSHIWQIMVRCLSVTLQKNQPRAISPQHFDILCGGFPCQAFSLAGHRLGFKDETRGTLFFEIEAILRKHQPRAFFLENVKGLAIHDKGRTLKTILGHLDDAGYDVVPPQILNAMDFGVPQHRERIYIIGFRKNLHINTANFHYPEPQTKGENRPRFRDVMENEVPSVKYYLSTTYVETLKRHRARHEAAGHGFGYEIIDTDGVANAIVVGGMGRERNLLIDKRLKDFTPITNIKGEVNREGIRRMTPREWARLQGFPDKFKIVVADASAYKQFGNSVAIPAIQATAEKELQMLGII